MNTCIIMVYGCSAGYDPNRESIRNSRLNSLIDRRFPVEYLKAFLVYIHGLK